MTLLELTVVILVLLSLITILFIGARSWKQGSDRAGCIMLLRKAQQAVRGYQNTHALLDGAAIDVNTDLIGPGKLLEVAPRCPGGGTYAYGSTIPMPGAMIMTCSLSGSNDHAADATADW
jgi:type II secretory pathway pseudopilin PulG